MIVDVDPAVVIGIDPGSTTGLAFYRSVDEVVTTHLPVHGTVLTLIDTLALERDATVVCERFDVTPETVRTARNPDPYHLEGFLKLYCLAHDVPFHQYGRADAKHFATDRKLRSLGWWRSNVHERDALRQVLTHVANDHDVRTTLAKRLYGHG